MSNSKVIKKSDGNQHFDALPSLTPWQQMEETFDKFFNHQSPHQAGGSGYVSTEMDLHPRSRKAKEKATKTSKSN